MALQPWGGLQPFKEVLSYDVDDEVDEYVSVALRPWGGLQLVLDRVDTLQSYTSTHRSRPTLSPSTRRAPPTPAKKAKAAIRWMSPAGKGGGLPLAAREPYAAGANLVPAYQQVVGAEFGQLRRG